MPSDDGQILGNLRSHPMTAADFRRIALSLEGVEEYSHAGLPAFRVGGRKFASLASQAGGYGNLMLDAGAAGGVCGGGTRDFPADSRRLCFSLSAERRNFAHIIGVTVSDTTSETGMGRAQCDRKLP
jgi:hypothetical protein